MTTVELLSNLRSLNVKLWVDGERLRYSAPPGKLSPELLKQLAGHKAAIINFLRDASDTSAPPPIEPVSRAQPLPLSYAQMRLWILNCLSTDNSAYHLPVALHLEGALDVEALRRSINEIVMRHEALRTVFTEMDGRPLQTILPSIEVSLPVIDLRSLTSAEKEAELQKLASENALRPFDLSRGPLLRAVVLMLGEQEHVLCVTLHHIVSDGWSSGVLVREFAALYEVFSSGRAPSLPPLKVQYADFAVWQRQYLQGRVLERQLDYWKSRLGDHPPVLELPTDKPRPAAQTFRGATEVLRLPPPLVEALNDLSRRHEVTLFMLLLAAFQSQLCRYTGQDDITVGTPIANRNRAETEPLIGFFVNTLVLRTDLSGDPSFSDLLQRVRETALEAYAHQDLPFELLVEELQPRREANRTPLFQIAFVLQNAPMRPLHLPGLTITVLPLENKTAKFDLTLTLRESENGELTAALEYNTDIFNRSTVRRMLEHYEVLLRGVVKNPDLRLSWLPLITQQERRQLLHEGETAAPEFPDGEPLHRLFEARAAAAPDSTALIVGEERLSYRQLNARANQLAHRLRGLGIGPDSLVSIGLERSVEMVVAVLGVLKAGGAYVPLDPASPAERLAWQLEDSRSPVLITSSTLLDRLPSHEAELLVLDDERDALAHESDENPCTTATAHNLAYVIYTSGSTGRPKGTLVTHYNVTRLFAATQPWFEFTERDVWTLFHSYAFDFSVWELWGALLYGGRLVVVPYAVSRSPAAFYELLVKQRVTVLNQTPSAFRQLIQAEEEAGVSPDLSLRLVIFGGEALELQSLRPWYERHGSTSPQLVNMYGITETTVHVTYRLLTASDLTATPGSVIGGPIPDLQVYILDRHMQPVPISVPGEMYVGGAGLARGYLNRPDLTALRYVPHPFDVRPGQRLYRSGDLARYLEDGDIEYLGRADRQVKIRGHRIELGEIEATLNQHPAVRESIVVAGDHPATDLSRLVAYIVPRHTLGRNIDELRGWLKRTLPDYMVPQLFVTLDSLPLTANGKVDYRALPEADMARPELGQGYIAPRTRAERELAEVWSEVLGFERVGVYDNFFDLGGDSIRAIQVHSKAQQRGVAFPPQELFLSQTIAELAASSATGESPVAQRSSEAFSLVTEEDRTKLPADIEDAYPLAMLQTGMIFHKEYSTTSTAYLNVSSVHLRASFDRAALEAALRQLAQRHPILRTSFDLTSFSEPLQLVHRYAEIPLKMEDLRALNSCEQEEVIEAWVRDEQGLDFDLTRAPLLRFTVHLRGENTFQLSWTEHHAILDGWSMATMMTELFRLYFSITGEEVAPVLPPPQSTYRDFIALERATLLSEESQNFWKEKLAGHNVVALTPHSKPDSEVANRQRRRVFSVAPELSAALKRLASSAGVPLRNVLLAAHLKVLSVLANQRDVLTGVASHGRLEEADGERVLGLFLNTLPLRARLHGGSWLDLIRETFGAEQELMPFRRYPLAELQRRFGDGSPLFEVMFNFVHFHVYEGLQEFPGLEIIDVKGAATTNYTLLADFNLDPRTQDLQFRLEYNAAKLSDADAIGSYYLRVFEAMSAEPSSDYISHSLLSAEEKHRLLIEWNDTAREYPRFTSIHQLFEQQAAATPKAVALVFGEERLTYGELNARANQLAHHLRRCGVGPDVLVGLCMERSVEMIVGILGVLKAGGAYAPLDPVYPLKRLEFMIDDLDAPVLLIQEHLAVRLSAHGRKVISLDVEWDEIAGECRENPPNLTVADNLAYVIYTSGTTGQPKGVAVPHRGVVRLVRGANYAAFGEDEVILQAAPISFDASTFEIWGALLNGGKLVLMSPGVLSLEDLAAALERHQITTLWLTAGLFHLMVDERLDALRRVRQLLAGGDVLSVPHVRTALARLPETRLINGYGPTENTTFTCCYMMSGRQDEDDSVPIGRPISNTTVFILDVDMHLVPIGVAGELYIGGDGLARGYLHHPALTAEKFVPHPFAHGQRLYRTGDLVRYLADGRVEFLGRIDQQVKIRGFRVELGEIEAALSECPAVRECVVVARGDTLEEKRLVAYVVVADEANTADRLREFLTDKLPEYMMPSGFVILDSLPLMPNGKVNRKALPPPHALREEQGDSYVSPRDTIELRLCRLWEDVLGVRPVGARDNFFDLGGNSLLAVRLMAQTRKEFDRDIPINVLFQASTVEHLAGVLRGEPGSQSFSSVVGIQTSGSSPPLFFIHPIGGTVFCYLELAKYLGKDQPLYGLQAAGIYGEQEPLSRVEDLAAHYVSAVRNLQPRGPYHLGGWSMGGVVAFEMARQLREQGQEVAVLALIDSALPRHAARLGDSIEEEARLLSTFLYDLGAQSGKDLPDLSERLRGLSAEEQVACLLEHAEAHDILPPQAQLENLLNVFKSNVRALTSYAPERYEGRLQLFRAAEGQARADDTLGWDSFAAEVVTYSVPGNHYTVMTDTNVEALAALLKTHLEQGASKNRMS